MRKPKDRDFIRTNEDLIFCVVGYLHPPDRLLAYLKYIPSDSGIWAAGNLHFKRMIRYYSSKSVSDTFFFLKNRYPKYLFYFYIDNITFPCVPYSDIKEYYKPEEKLAELAKEGEKLDALQLRAVELAEYLSDKAGVPFERFGVTGSILLGIHNLLISDVDLTIYGHKNALLVKQALIEEYKKTEIPLRLRQLNRNEVEEWCTKKTKQFSIDYESAALILKKKWNFGFYKEKFFSIHPIKLDSEIIEKYGEKKFASEGTVEITANVVDNTEALFNPASYKVSEVRILKGLKVNDIKEVVSFEGVFSDLASPNQLISAKGNLEVVVDVRSKETYHRVVVGSKNVGSPELMIPVS